MEDGTEYLKEDLKIGEIIFNPLSISPILTVVSPDPAGPGDGLHLDGLVELLGHGVAHSRAETGDHQTLSNTKTK